MQMSGLAWCDPDTISVPPAPKPQVTQPSKFVGLDVETTGTDVAAHVLIQIGVYDPISGDVFRSDVYPAFENYAVDPQALQVNGFTMDRIEAAPAASLVDTVLCLWLDKHELVGAHPVGFNVASFDLPFVKRALPVAFSKLSYRTIDLNAVLFTITEIIKSPPGKVGHAYETFKHRAKAFGATQVKGKTGAYGWHDAAFDAVASYHAWVYLRSVITSMVGP